MALRLSFQTYYQGAQTHHALIASLRNRLQLLEQGRRQTEEHSEELSLRETVLEIKRNPRSQVRLQAEVDGYRGDLSCVPPQAGDCLLLIPERYKKKPGRSSIMF